MRSSALLTPPPQPAESAVCMAQRTAGQDMAGVSIGIAAWGLVTGVAMVQSGLPVWAALLMSFTVYAGSAQLAALPLIMARAPVWVILATVFCVNLRFVIYSAQWRPYLMHLSPWRRCVTGYLTTDMTYVLCLTRYPQAPLVPHERDAVCAYISRTGAISWAVWQVASVVGIAAAGWIPSHWGLGFAGVLAVWPLLWGQLQEWRTALIALISGLCALMSHGLPFQLHIVVTIGIALVLGVCLDRLARGSRPSCEVLSPRTTAPSSRGQDE